MTSFRTPTKSDRPPESPTDPVLADVASRVAVGAAVAEMAIVGRCFPSGLRGEPIAGDYFDVCLLDDARTLIAVGDVIGHGHEAAGRMEALRAEGRALAMGGLSVADVVRRLDVWLDGQGLEELATLWLGIFDRKTDWLEYASAGHVPPVLASVDGTCLLSEASAPPLGTGEVDRQVLADRTRFSAGSLLVVYSDGLIERPGLDLEDQIEKLRAIVHEEHVAALSQDALERLVERVLCRVPLSPASAPDDVCILAVHRPLVPVGGVGYLTQRSG